MFDFDKVLFGLQQFADTVGFKIDLWDDYCEACEILTECEFKGEMSLEEHEKITDLICMVMDCMTKKVATMAMWQRKGF